MSENTAIAATPAAQDAAPARKPATAGNGKPAGKGKPAPAGKSAGKGGIRLFQARILVALNKGAKLSRTKLCERAGFKPGSGTLGVALGGRSNAGGHYDGLVPQGLVRRVELDVDGAEEVAYEITPKGKKALAAFLVTMPKGKLPAVRGAGNGD